MGHLLQPARPDAVGGSLVFLHLLEGEAKCATQLFLGHCKHLAAHPHPAADVLVDGIRNRHGRPLAKAMSENRPNAGTSDIPIQRAIFGRKVCSAREASGALTDWTPRAVAGCPRSLAHLAAG